jgi:hypothetical protein
MVTETARESSLSWMSSPLGIGKLPVDSEAGKDAAGVEKMEDAQRLTVDD